MIGRTVTDIRALLLTDGHFDHVGLARGYDDSSARPSGCIPPIDDLPNTPTDTAERDGSSSPLVIPAAFLGAMVAAGALIVRGVTADYDWRTGKCSTYPDGRSYGTFPDIPLVSALLLPERTTVLTGDALVTLDP